MVTTPQGQRPKKPKANPSEYAAIASQFAAAKRAKALEEAQKAQRAMQPERAAASAMERHRIARELGRKTAYERRWLWTMGFWLWLLVLHATGILYFTSGFLLTRLVLDERSACAVNPLGTAGGSPAEGCWHPKTFERAVIIVIDALRYDFTVPMGDGAEFHDAFPFLYETAVAHPEQAFLRPFIADPPTATLQRLQGLMTGTLPTFIDIGANFAGSAVEEDSLLAQLRDTGHKVAQLGDDTWTSLFPGYFEPNISRAYDSFNVWDLDTVDDGVAEHIFPLLAEKDGQDKQWDVLIGHCLGVDHAGHRYGPAHAAMRAKLQQMDAFVRRVAALLDDDTLLVVMGDHGMDSKGDHGGESDDEVEAALWMYAQRPVFGRTSAAAAVPPQTAKERAVNQIDFVPTLALLLGIPIPYNNLGWPIAEAFVGAAAEQPDWANLARVGAITAAGIDRYQESYMAARRVELGASASQGISRPATVAGEDAEAMFAVLSQYQASTLQRCKDLWARFDVGSMVFGVAIMVAGVAVMVVYASRPLEGDEDDEDIALLEDATLEQAELLLEIQGELAGDGQTNKSAATPETPETPQTQAERAEERALQHQQELHALLVKAAVTAAVPTVVLMGLWSAVRGGPWYAGVGYGAMASVGAVLSRLLGVGQRRLARLVPGNVWSWLAVTLTVAPAIGFASNSYTVWEDQQTLFLLSTFGAVAATQALRLPTAGDRVLGVYHAAVFVALGRVAAVSHLCREEQLPWCQTTFYASGTSSTSAPWQVVVPFVVAAVLPSVVRSFYTPTRSYAGLAPVWIGGVFRGGLVLAALHGALEAAGATKTVMVVVAQTALGLAVVAGAVAFAWAGPCVTVTASTVGGPDGVGGADGDDAGAVGAGIGRRAQVAVLGYANAHGARYLLLPANVLVAVAVVSKPMGGGALALLLWQVLALAELLELLGGAARRTAGPVVLALLASLHFFATGHQAVLSSIQWDSAFVALTTVRYPWSPLAVAANTFAAHLVVVAAVPLVVVLWKTGPRRRGGLLSPTSRALAGFAAVFAVQAAASMACAGHLRRHLMLYRIFCPRFLLAAAALLVVDVAAMALALPGLRANTLAVFDVFGWVDDY